MLLLILLVVGIIGGALLIKFSKNFGEIVGEIGGYIIVFSAIILLVCLLCLAGFKTDIKTDLNEYEEHSARIEAYYKSGNTFELSNINTKTFEINTRIELHNRKSGNWWNGVYYSKKIGNLEKLNYLDE